MDEKTEHDVQINSKSWMGDLIQENPNITVGQLLIPGTHDSAAYTLTPLYGARKNYLNRMAALPLVGRLIRAVASISACTQKLPIKQQLETGARSLDLRVLYSEHPAPGQFSLAHKLTCIPLQTCLNDIQAFFQENPDEMLIVNIKPEWDNQDTLVITDENKSEAALKIITERQSLLQEFLVQQFEHHLWKTNGHTSLSTQPLSSMKGKVVFAFTDLPVSPDNGIHLKEALSNANWANKHNVEDCFSKGQTFLEQQLNDKAHIIEIDSSPTPSTKKSTALIFYKISSSVKLYSLVCVFIKPFSRLFKDSPDSFPKHFLEANNTTLEKNGQAIRERLIKETIPKLNRGGIVFPSDFFCGESAYQFTRACIEKSAELAEICAKESADAPEDVEHKEQLSIENELSLNLGRQILILSTEHITEPLHTEEIEHSRSNTQSVRI